MAALRPETKARARALQLLYAWDLSGRPPIREVGARLVRADPRRHQEVDAAVSLAEAVARDVGALDATIAEAADNWRLERIGVIERNILRLGLLELTTASVPPRVAITEAVRLAHWFVDPRAAAFVNGVLDGVARRAGRL